MFSPDFWTVGGFNSIEYVGQIGSSAHLRGNDETSLKPSRTVWTDMNEFSQPEKSLSGWVHIRHSIHTYRFEKINNYIQCGHLKGQCVVFVSPLFSIAKCLETTKSWVFSPGALLQRCSLQCFSLRHLYSLSLSLPSTPWASDKTPPWRDHLWKGGIHGPMASENRCDYIGVFWMNDWWYWWVMVHDDDSWWW